MEAQLRQLGAYNDELLAQLKEEETEGAEGMEEVGVPENEPVDTPVTGTTLQPNVIEEVATILWGLRKIMGLVISLQQQYKIDRTLLSIHYGFFCTPLNQLEFFLFWKKCQELSYCNLVCKMLV